MPSLPPKGSNYRFLRIAVEMLFILSFGFVAIVAPIWGHYEPHIYGPDGRMRFATKLLLGAGLISVFGVPWLLLQYGGPLVRKHPVIFGPRYRLLRVIALPLFYLFGYLLFKHTLWG